jgi:hypothetical protein
LYQHEFTVQAARALIGIEIRARTRELGAVWSRLLREETNGRRHEPRYFSSLIDATAGYPAQRTTPKDNRSLFIEAMADATRRRIAFDVHARALHSSLVIAPDA